MYQLNLPINGVSFGQVSLSILRELFKSNRETPSIFPIGGSLDFSSQQEDKPFFEWIFEASKRAPQKYKASKPVFKLWHLNGSIERFAKKQALLTFYELDSPTETELNIARNQDALLVTSEYTKGIFNSCGLDNVHIIPLGFDSSNFFVKQKNFFKDSRIVFNLTGKLEKRKGHKKAILAWIKKFGGNPKYALQCAVYNPFLFKIQNGQSVDYNKNAIADMLQGVDQPFNVDFLPYMGKNSLYNDYLNSGNIVIGMGTEGWGLPEFNSVALGKHAVILDAAGHKEWATTDNSCLVKPSSKIAAYDNVFFLQGADFNQGQIFDFNEDEFIAACEDAIKRVENNPINSNGLLLQERFSYKNSLEKIDKVMNTL